MEITELSLRHTNRLVEDLVHARLNTVDYFDYQITNNDVYEKRMNDLKNRTFAREELSDYLLSYHRKHFPENHAVTANIERLKQPDSLVVVGGQQAGLLTGPLYTIHKIISILVLSKQQEAELSVPVIPIFWVAGEDHDFAEINHLYVSQNQVIKKKAIKHMQSEKIPVFHKELDKKECWNWICSVFETFGETDYSNTLLASLKHTLSTSKTYTQFFEKLTYEMFSEYGLVIMNSADPDLRKMESPYFQQFIRKNEEISEALAVQQEFMNSAGYQPIIVTEKTSANLFYHHENHERSLLHRSKDKIYSVDDKLTFNEEELRHLAEQSPERLSNNVVTRPLMQECILPTLAFIAGPGELTYWAELKKVFQVLDVKMPPVVPRLNITILERSIETDMMDVEIGIEDVFTRGVDKAREEWVSKREPSRMTPKIEDTKKQFEQIHNELRKSALTIDKSLEPFLMKNAYFIQAQLDLLHSHIDKKIQQKHQVEMEKFTRIGKSLKPNDGFQERTWNIYYYLNKYGPNFLDEIVQLRYSFNNHHKIVKI
ncbi:bacillithiol biosynthesis cysteine-adding enzyme BshC [Peribacillus frigoritolerans]|uniref:bacillithiol biosynthesis cysteine-adding enzyme BshC n=1 Tax=Peribacillus frigoritolerans TaxID=450367 RepID=UPI001059E1CF|nr:bacillithiol biosynthesis cysteine-adding enzyme BshC [Peribacillus frigoritolerans]TDL79973.1 bacillithiol biosynthesis cysteine-adding enzyme BshC [Peribacillus frigoritolerans]